MTLIEGKSEELWNEIKKVLRKNMKTACQRPTNRRSGKTNGRICQEEKPKPRKRKILSLKNVTRNFNELIEGTTNFITIISVNMWRWKKMWGKKETLPYRSIELVPQLTKRFKIQKLTLNWYLIIKPFDCQTAKDEQNIYSKISI